MRQNLGVTIVIDILMHISETYSITLRIFLGGEGAE
jgi:hypothetical protein